MMTREEYISQLSKLLRELPVQERKEAIAFVQEYFDEADNDQAVIHRLGSPESYASSLMEEMKDLILPVLPDDEPVKKKNSQVSSEAPKKHKVLIAILLILASPLIVILLFAAFMFLFVGVTLAAALLMFFGMLSISGLMIAFLETYKAIVLISKDLLGSFFDLGLVLFGIGLFILCGWVFLRLCRFWIPAAFQTVRSGFNIFKNRVRRAIA